ncbi:SDR family oxidoreductase [Phycicoccus avicenniae]|uniref:SDR family oxidoreductase n=1 Tax=Phycicoccus avicenniae TaxID=2828860 RepID=UPI003D2C7356
MTALVTGASGGLGRAVAVALAAAGHDVGVHYRGDADGAAGTCRQVEHTGRRGVALHADLAVVDAAGLDAAVADLLDRCAAEVGEPSVLVLNAAPQDHLPWDDLDTAAWDAHLVGGLRPSAALLRGATTRMTDGGVVVVVGSVEGVRATAAGAAYGATKAALHHLVASSAQVLGRRGVRVVGVAPGLVHREGLEQDWPEGVARWRAASALGRPVLALEVAATIAFLSSPAASGITGTTVAVDAGWSAAPGW